MNADRAQAYGRLMRLIDDVGPSKLLPDEQELLREAADTLLFCDAPACAEEARDALLRIEQLGGHLVATERWSRENADALVEAVEACGALELVV
jgi:hypothetical protein